MAQVIKRYLHKFTCRTYENKMNPRMIYIWCCGLVPLSNIFITPLSRSNSSRYSTLFRSKNYWAKLTLKPPWCICMWPNQDDRPRSHRWIQIAVSLSSGFWSFRCDQLILKEVLCGGQFNTWRPDARRRTCMMPRIISFIFILPITFRPCTIYIYIR